MSKLSLYDQNDFTLMIDDFIEKYEIDSEEKLEYFREELFQLVDMEIDDYIDDLEEDEEDD